METPTNLTAAEARAVTHLWRLRHQHPMDQNPAIGAGDLAKLLGTRAEDLARISRKARQALPSNLVASDARMSWLEAETVLAIHAARGTTGEERLPLCAVAGALGVSEEELQPLVRDARERLSVAESITRLPEGPTRYREGFGVAVGENPYSWQILWLVVLVIVTIVGGAFLVSH
jgi:hypothetical protein